MNDQELQTKADADAIANRIFVDYQARDALPKSLLSASSQVPQSSTSSPPHPLPIPACSPGVVICDVRVPWNSVARMVAQVVVAFVLLALALAGLIGAVIWALRCV